MPFDYAFAAEPSFLFRRFPLCTILKKPDPGWILVISLQDTNERAMKMILITAVALAIATPAVAQSYNPDLGPAGNVVPPPGYSGYYGYPGYWHGYWGARGAYPRVSPWAVPHRYGRRHYRIR